MWQLISLYNYIQTYFLSVGQAWWIISSHPQHHLSYFFYVLFHLIISMKCDLSMVMWAVESLLWSWLFFTVMNGGIAACSVMCLSSFSFAMTLLTASISWFRPRKIIQYNLVCIVSLDISSICCSPYLNNATHCLILWHIYQYFDIFTKIECSPSL